MPKQFDNMVSTTDRQKKSHDGKTLSKESVKDWRLLEFFVPIEEALQDENDFIIKGVAINETITLNNVKYISEELERAAPSFRGVPILLDHVNEVKNIVGRTTQNVNWNPNSRRIEFEAKIMDKDIQERIKDGRIGSVSIGARVEDLIEEDDGSMKAIGIKGMEISLVAVAGDSNATLAHALQQSCILKEKAMMESYSYSTPVDKKLNLEENTMSEEEQKVETPETSEEPVETSETSEESKETPREEKREEVAEEKGNSDIEEMKKQISAIKELLIEKKQVKEEAMKETEDKTKGKVSTKTEEALNDIGNRIVEAVGGRSFSMYRDYTKEDDESSLKRLIR